MAPDVENKGPLEVDNGCTAVGWGGLTGPFAMWRLQSEVQVEVRLVPVSRLMARVLAVILGIGRK